MIEVYYKPDYKYFYYDSKRERLAVRRRPYVRDGEIDITPYSPFSQQEMSFLCMINPDVEESLLKDLFSRWESFELDADTTAVWYITSFHGVI